MRKHSKAKRLTLVPNLQCFGKNVCSSLGLSLHFQVPQWIAEMARAKQLTDRWKDPWFSINSGPFDVGSSLQLLLLIYNQALNHDQ